VPQTNCNLLCGGEYSADTKRCMALMSEKEAPFELVDALLRYIETLQVAGAVLVFLAGWNLIYSMQRYLETNPHFGTPRAAKQTHPRHGTRPPPHRLGSLIG